MTMTSLRQHESKMSIGRFLRVFAIVFPILVGLFIILFTEASYWRAEMAMPGPKKGGFLTIIFSSVGAVIGHSVSFIIISVLVRNLINRGSDRREICIQLSSMLIPVAPITAYWLSTNVDPFMLALLTPINIMLIGIGYLIGRVAAKKSDKRMS